MTVHYRVRGEPNLVLGAGSATGSGRVLLHAAHLVSTC
jgi:hypothetical protein